MRDPRPSTIVSGGDAKSFYAMQPAGEAVPTGTFLVHQISDSSQVIERAKVVRFDRSRYGSRQLVDFKRSLVWNQIGIEPRYLTELMS